MELYKEPKIIQNFAFKTRAGSSPGNIPKTNQDNYIICPSFCGAKDYSFFAVCDGHGYFLTLNIFYYLIKKLQLLSLICLGVNGHLVSTFVKHTLPSKI